MDNYQSPEIDARYEALFRTTGQTQIPDVKVAEAKLRAVDAQLKGIILRARAFRPKQ